MSHAAAVHLVLEAPINPWDVALLRRPLPPQDKEGGEGGVHALGGQAENMLSENMFSAPAAPECIRGGEEDSDESESDEQVGSIEV